MALFSGKRKPPVLHEQDLDFLAAHTACDREQLRQQFDNFVAHHPNGFIKPKEFKVLMSSCFPNRDYDRLQKRIFNMYDNNRDGHICFKEFMLVMYVLSNGTPEENLRQIFRVFDVNGDGTISRKEMKKIVKDLYHLLQRQPEHEHPSRRGSACSGLAASSSSSADLADLRSLSPSQLSESAFREMDTNADGRVSEDEFLRAVMQHEKVASMLALKIVQAFDPDGHV